MQSFLDEIRRLTSRDQQPRADAEAALPTDDQVADDIRAVPLHESVTFTEQLAQAICYPVQPLFPISQTFDNANAVTVPPSGDGVDMLKFNRIQGLVLAGVGTPNNGTAKVLAYWLGSNTNNGTYSAFSVNTTTTINTNNSMATLELRKDQLPTGNRYVKLAVLVPVANMILTAAIEGVGGPYSPVSQFDWSTNTALNNRIVY